MKAGKQTVPLHGVPCTQFSMLKCRGVDTVLLTRHLEFGLLFLLRLERTTWKGIPLHSLDHISVFIMEHVRILLEGFSWFLLFKTNSTKENKGDILPTSDPQVPLQSHYTKSSTIYTIGGGGCLKHQTQTIIQVTKQILIFSVQ